jgi:hypothetical protein
MFYVMVQLSKCLMTEHIATTLLPCQLSELQTAENGLEQLQ